MAKNKQHCLKCGMELDDYRMVLMIGPLGYRRYAVCLRCAGKAGAGAPKIGGRQREKARSAFSNQRLAKGNE